MVVGLIWLGLTVYRRMQRAARRPSNEPAKLVRCTVCGVFVPQSDVKSGADGTFSCTHHGTGRER